MLYDWSMDSNHSTYLGSQNDVVCAREGGANTTPLFPAAHFALQNTNSVGVQSEGAAEGGCGGNSAAPEPKRSPAALLVQNRSQQKSFLFLLEGKIRRAQKKSRENFFAGWRALASGGGAERVNFAQNRFGFGHIIAPRLNFPIFGRRDWPRFARLNRETLARRAQRGSPSAGSKSLAILSICFAQ
jgi:hypothetical protein